MGIFRAVLIVFSILSLGGLVVASWYWRKGIENEDEERMMYGKRATLGALLIFLVCVGSTIALWMLKSAPSSTPSTPPVVNVEKSSLGVGTEVREGMVLDPLLPPTLRTGSIDYHYPTREEVHVPLNTFIVMHAANDKVGFTDRDIVMRAKDTTKVVVLNRVAITGDVLTMALKPHERLEPNTVYVVTVKGYSWEFTTGTDLDTSSPEVVSTQPDLKDSLPRNTIVEFTFSESVLLAKAHAVTVGKVNMSPQEARVRQAPPYKAIDVVGYEVCGLNTCKQQIYCFSSGATLRIALQDQAIIDFAGNYLTGGGIHTATIGDKVSIPSPLTVIRTVPFDLEVGVDTKAPLEVWFSNVVAKSSLTPTAVTLNHPELNTWISVFDTIDTAATTAEKRFVQPRATKVFLWHDAFKAKTIYYATVAPGVHDIFQNCTH